MPAEQLGNDWMQDYIGIPYMILGRSGYGLDCWGMISMVYRLELGVRLPDWIMDSPKDAVSAPDQWREIKEPIDMCLVRSMRSGMLPDHWGVYYAGHVLQASAPFSTYVPIDQFMRVNPNTVFGVFSFEETKLS